ncbi:hypothetical protein BGZ89_005035 [Linnemannia elongata]|nr:hypothetical protein BGZ89_005035 [Linnemannia elongata]
MGGKMAVILYRPSTTSSHFTRHLLIRKHCRYISDRAYGIDTYIQSTYDSCSMPILEDRANRSGSDGSTVRVHDSFSCSSGDDARCAKSEFSNDSGDDPGCGDGSDDNYRDNGDYFEIGGWPLCVYVSTKVRVVDGLAIHYLISGAEFVISHTESSYKSVATTDLIKSEIVAEDKFTSVPGYPSTMMAVKLIHSNK